MMLSAVQPSDSCNWQRGDCDPHTKTSAPLLSKKVQKKSVNLKSDFSVHVCMCICMYVCVHVCMYLSIYACMYVCMYLCIHACMYMFMSLYVCMYVCMYAFVFFYF